jgi:ketosteroid isomerase-like protein
MPALPTLDLLGAKLPENVDAQKEAAAWLTSFAENLQSSKIDKIMDGFLEDSFVRDLLAFTWDMRTFEGAASIKKFFSERASKVKFEAASFKVTSADLQQPYPDLAWIQAFFTFETDVGLCSGIVRLVPVPQGNSVVWKAHLLFTNLENLKAFPEKIGNLRNQMPNHGKWAEQRRREAAFEDGDPAILVVGGGQSGLDIAARLKALDIPSVVIERNKRIGDNWRNRYEALCLHDPVWYDHMPYLP